MIEKKKNSLNQFSNDDFVIIEEKDISFSNIVRFSISVAVSGKPSFSDLKEIASKIIDLKKSKIKFNAISIAFYDQKEYLGLAATLGIVEFAPNGKWEDANSVNSGDFNTMSYNYKLKKKNWSKQLTEKEVKIFSAWEKFLDNSDDEDLANIEIGKKYNLSSDKVREICLKQTEWTFNDEK